MASTRKKKFEGNPNLTKYLPDNFGMIYNGILTDESFQALKPMCKLFYIICIVHAQSEKGRRCLYNHGLAAGTKYDKDNDFVFPARHMLDYGVKRSNGSSYLKELIAAGFITKKEGNKHRFKMNVYSFSSDWKVKNRVSN